jgi:hypothetical protein
VLRGEADESRDWVFYQNGKPGVNLYAARERDWKLDYNDRLFDMSDGFHEQPMVDKDANAAAKAAYGRLRAVLDELDPEGGHLPPPSSHGGQLMGITYRSSIPSGGMHPDRHPPHMLLDNKFKSVFKDSVEYEGNPVITFDILEDRPVETIAVKCFSRGSYRLSDMEVEVSSDGVHWEPAEKRWKEIPTQEGPRDEPGTLVFEVGEEISQFRVAPVAANGKRVLLSEVIVK